MADNDKKPIVHVVPAILTGAAALIAALTTVYVNVRGDKATPTTPASHAAATAPRNAAATTTTLRLQLERIAVQHDGSVGTTDWRFAVAADGQPLFVLRQDDLDETGGRNVALPSDAMGDVELAAGRPLKISIEGWRGSRLRLIQGAPDVRGAGMLSASGAMAPIMVRADKPEEGAFVFYFSARRAGDAQ